MGAGGQFDSEKFFHETDETRAAARDDLFEKILERLKASGATINSDEEFPYYREISNGQEEETGTERIIEFEMNEDDMRISRVVEHSRITPHGVEKRDMPDVKITLKRKPAGSDRWEPVDLSSFS